MKKSHMRMILLHGLLGQHHAELPLRLQILDPHLVDHACPALVVPLDLGGPLLLELPAALALGLLCACAPRR